MTFHDVSTLGAQARSGVMRVSPPRSRRVLITGVGRFWGGHLVRQLERDHSLEFVAAVDTREPQGDFSRAEVVRGDIRNPAISRLLDVTRVDTVVHTQVFGADRPGESSRLLHDMNVIGTMNLLAACASSPNVRKVIIRSSTSIYGASPRDPAFFTEDMEARSALRDQYSRDIAEVEAYARDYAHRAPHACVTILRFANSIGESVDTAFTRYLSAQVVPMHAGFNPRLQFIMDSDAVDALAHAVRVWKPGVFNIAGPGTVRLAKFLRMAGRVPMPLIPPVMAPVLSLLERTGTLYVPIRYDRTLRFGRGVSTRRMIEEFGFTPEYTTREAAEKFANFVRMRRYQGVDDTTIFDGELLDYVQHKLQQLPSVQADTFARFARRSSGDESGDAALDDEQADEAQED